jgi:hypothetical protein
VPPIRVTVAEACVAFVTNRQSGQVAPATLRKYRTFTKQLTAYADSRGYVMIEQWQPGDVDLFYASLKLGRRTKGKRLGILPGVLSLLRQPEMDRGDAGQPRRQCAHWLEQIRRQDALQR